MREIWGMVYTILIHAPMKGATRERNDARAIANILIHAPMKGATSEPWSHLYITKILIHAPMKGATAKSHKIDSDFTVLFRKFMQKLGIAIFTISIF